jgi:hypothetical protein
MKLGPLDTWSKEQHKLAAAEFGSLLLLHSELHQVPMDELFEGPGYSLKIAFNTAAMGHNLKIELKHMALDVLMRVIHPSFIRVQVCMCVCVVCVLQRAPSPR